MNKLMDLNGGWDLYLAPNAEVVKRGFCATCAADLANTDFCHVAAEVPGNFELDLQRAGLFPDPFFGTNPLLCQKEENKHLWYIRTFSMETITEGELFLRFEGIDTFAEIYLNGTKLGECDNMLVEHEYKAEGLRVGQNELLVHILPTAIVIRQAEGSILNGGQKYNLDSIHARKAPYMFGWDIMPRMVSGGIWRPVSLVAKPLNRLTEFYIATQKLDTEVTNTAALQCFFRIETQEDLLDGFEVVIRGVCGQSVFEKRQRLWNANTVTALTVSEPLLWWPRGVGEQNLYDVTAELYLHGTLCDSRSCRLGIRTVALDRTSVIDEDGTGKFEFVINGKKVFILGTNWVPLDAFPSQNEKRLDRGLRMVEDIGCNMIRCWGGNVYESDTFFEFCDEHGIMIWQDFIMGCAYYPQYASFCEALRAEAIAAVKRLRSHPSLVLWAGDNECDAFCKGNKKNGVSLDPNDNVLTRRVLPEVLQTYDPFRPYLPSSPYVDPVAFATGRPLSEEHLWGPRNYFKSSYYKNSQARFASETGFHGCPSPDSLKRFIGTDHLWPHMREDGRPDEEWLAHAASMELEDIGPYEYRINLMNRQVAELFGSLPDESPEQIRQSRNSPEVAKRFHEKIREMFASSPAPLEDYARASQIFQAEGFKFMIEHFRIRKATHGGLIWWNLLDGWPQISDAVVDYYFCKKLAYDYIANSQQPLCLMFDEPVDGKITLYAANDLPTAQTLTYRVTRVSDGTVLLEGDCTVDESGITKLESLPVTEEEREWYLIEWTDATGTIGHNHFVSNIRGISYETYLTCLQKTQIGHFEGFTKGETK